MCSNPYTFKNFIIPSLSLPSIVIAHILIFLKKSCSERLSDYKTETEYSENFKSTEENQCFLFCDYHLLSICSHYLTINDLPVISSVSGSQEDQEEWGQGQRVFHSQELLPPPFPV
jgi:hypothetical protein